MKNGNYSRWIAIVAVAAMAALCFIWQDAHVRKPEIGLMSGSTALASPVPPGAPASFSDIVEKIAPSVVNIYTTSSIKGRGDPFWRYFQMPPERKQQSLGSGFVIDEDGYILTNFHVVENADEIKAQFEDGKTYMAKVVGVDPQTDLALIKVEPKGKLPFLRMGDSDVLKVGDWVLAAGNPFGLSNTVTAGIVSAKDRFIGNTAYDDLIQTDASINPGNSGGPLINLAGEVVGVNQSIFTRSGGNIGIGFAVPINIAKRVIPQLKHSGEVTRAWLGVSMQGIDFELAESFGLDRPMGALVAQVVPGSPADKYGIQEGDIIIKVDGDIIEDPNELMRKISLSPVDSKVMLTVIRDGKELQVPVVLTSRPENLDMLARNPQGRDGVLQDQKLDVSVTNIPPDMVQRLGIERGVLVVDVKRGGAAANGGIEQGDIIMKINNFVINDLNDFQKAVAQLKSGRIVRMHVRRGNTKIFMAFPL